MNTEFQNLPNVVSPKEVQTYFGISRSTTYRIFHDASFPAFHIGNRLLVRRDELLDWLEPVSYTHLTLPTTERV